jgi:cbb3-type cytochrome c oxidase subunit III
MVTFVKNTLLTITLLLCAWQALPASQEKAGADAETARTAELFSERCARCHGEDGRGQTVIGRMLDAPDFTDERWWGEGKDGRRFVRSINEGKGEMPAFGRKLSRSEIKALAAYVSSFRKSER